MRQKQRYRYTECGLDNVVIEGLEIVTDDAGEKVYCITNIVSLHRAITYSIVTQETGISGSELRFLRTEMGLSQAGLGEILKVSRPTLNRWEHGKTDIAANAEVVIRMLAAERLNVGGNPTIEDMAKRCVWSADRGPIRIDGSNPGNYKALAA